MQRDYEWEVIDHPSSGVDKRFDAPRSGARSTTVLVKPVGAAAWIGSFAAPDPGTRGLSTIVRTPSPQLLCVIERGTGFLVNVRDPDEFEIVPAIGDLDAEATFEEVGLLLLARPWTVTAIGADGVRWTTPRISIDGVVLEGTDQGAVIVTTDPHGEPRSVRLDPLTGAALGR